MTEKQSSSPAIRKQTEVSITSPLSLSWQKTRKGTLLLEAIIAIGIFSLFLGGIGVALLLGQHTTLSSGDRTRAAFIAEQQLEGVRQMRNANFDSVTTGTKGIILTATGWAWSGNAVKINGFTGSVTVTRPATDWLEVQSRVTWNFGKARSGSVLLTSTLTNWRKTATVGNWANMTRIANVSLSGTPDLQNIIVNGTYAYITGTQASGGAGLYIYDISNPTTPVRVSSAFDLGSAGYGIAAVGNRLYIATDSPTQELQVYDIASPTTLVAANLVNSYDLPGSGTARSVTVYGENVFVGTTNNPPENQFFSIQMSETGPMVLNDSFNLSGSVLGMALQDGYAYIANSYNIGELSVVDIFDPEALTFAPGNGIDMTDTQDADSIALSGTSALIGRMNGSTIDELTLYDIGLSPVPSPPPGPWTLEIGGDALSLATIFGSRFAFVAGSAASAQLRVLDLVKMAQSQAPIVRTYNAGATMRSIFYDWQTDRLFTVTPSALMVFAPG